MKLERRTFLSPVSLDGESRKLGGHIAKYGRESALLTESSVHGPFTEIIAPGAFTRTLRDRVGDQDIVALFNHQESGLLGRTSSGTLVLREDEIGLAFELDLPDTQLGNDTRALVARGDIKGCSFGFIPVRDTFTQRSGKPQLRTLLDIELLEVTPACIWPAYSASEVAMRASQLRGETPESRRRYESAKRRLLINGIKFPA